MRGYICEIATTKLKIFFEVKLFLQFIHLTSKCGNHLVKFKNLKGFFVFYMGYDFSKKDSY